MSRIKIEPPPILEDIEDDLKSYLICPESLPIHQYESNQEFWPRKANPKNLLHFEESPLCSTLKVQRDLTTGEITDFKEVSIQDAGTGKNSMSFNRAPAPPRDSLRGNSSYVPFWPGSFSEDEVETPKVILPDTDELLTIPPGFTNGLTFDKDGKTLIEGGDNSERTELKPQKNVVNLLDLVQQEQDLLGAFETLESETPKEPEGTNETPLTINQEEEEVLAFEGPIITLNKPKTDANKKLEWAILLDTSKPVTNFHERIPEMAKKYDFELDTFQKLAILELEQHNHVFVAAHTSAGKTVVAEYAIALSQKHMTRTIYTSPIKALSNQKYRDFKQIFNDVGLITGDFQINQTASCLIMTTEILRTMLYCGSEVTRDLEYVIFDEVHYLNDPQRGYVWEQVLILLPPDVCVILLSATVPNTMEFADWLGRTHKRKVYVVTTQQRPVPLQHFLYTGHGGSTKDNRYLILDGDNWNMAGYSKAKESVPQVVNANSGNNFMNPKQEKTMWYALVDHLKRKNLLPVVAFTFSRKKCDCNGSTLTNLDLTTQKEKREVTLFFNKCIRNLKEGDQKIPQIVNMKDILVRGIGVHHSGVLPIVREIVEMLFQRGLIKVLFATETFAMGVNMPARTVVFDSIRKHDGTELRDLVPAEYIQMAGRAGRRGIDSKGTVIILCKRGIPPEHSLKMAMMGKPSLLVSQFRLTYGMVLSLLRVERISVEGMMSRSFREADFQKNMLENQNKLERIENEVRELTKQQLSSYLQPLVEFYTCGSLYLKQKKEIMESAMSAPKLQKVLVPGRLLLITHKEHINKLGLLLKVSGTKKQNIEVLVLTDTSNKEDEEEEKADLWYQMLGLADNKIFLPMISAGHAILSLTTVDIVEIATKIVKINADFILRDVEKRKMDRFKDDPPGQSCVQAVQELQTLSMQANESSSKIEYLHLIHDIKLNDQDIYDLVSQNYDLKKRLSEQLSITQIPNFQEHFSAVFKRKFLEDQRDELKMSIQPQSLFLYPEYKCRIELLQKFGYVDANNVVQLKGRVACEMGMNELLITELILRNILSNLKPPEIAALLTALVFNVKVRDEPLDGEKLTADLNEAIKMMTQIHREIVECEQSMGIYTCEFQDELNFNLAFVVYEWASAKPFAEIMLDTEIQEGIIVRAIQQLNEVICNIKRTAATIIGESELQTKMDEASNCIKRDIVFSASLYTNDE